MALRFRKAWRWPDRIEKLIRSLVKGSVLHVCSGDSKIGSVRIDLYKSADIKADMYHLPIRPQSFDTIVCDPPWNIPYHKRHRLLFELRDVLKPGGRLILNAFFLARVPCLKGEKTYIVEPVAAWRNISLVTTYRKVQAQLL